MTVVLDASVLVKWLLQDPRREADTVQATRLVESVVNGTQSAVQPPHWLAEVGAVLARESPGTASDDVVMLRALEIPVIDEPHVWRRACELAIDLKQHMFDTLYHAVHWNRRMEYWLPQTNDTCVLPRCSAGSSACRIGARHRKRWRQIRSRSRSNSQRQPRPLSGTAEGGDRRRDPVDPIAAVTPRALPLERYYDPAAARSVTICMRDFHLRHDLQSPACDRACGLA